MFDLQNRYESQMSPGSSSLPLLYPYWNSVFQDRTH